MQQKLSSKVIQCLISICRWFFKLKKISISAPELKKFTINLHHWLLSHQIAVELSKSGYLACISEKKPKVTIGFKCLHVHKLCKSVQLNNKLFSVSHIFLPSSVKTHLSEFYFSLSWMCFLNFFENLYTCVLSVLYS